MIMTCRKGQTNGRTTRLAIFVATLLLSAWWGQASQAASASLTFRLKGSDFSISGTVGSYDGKKWLVETPNFGEVQLDATKFDCLGSDCPTRPLTAAS